ncbi:MAG: CerR family C-terminal domain-containing protein [Gemmatimonadota bacterium]|nr:CerR family C-terminal domain-containing protein [Gemmatimonadota bacterium]MDE3126664.1 CerR family C-terminal domain-containing protein [Gemmatimonadota bacterium]MDE3215623.1 CerR family C-terminal domain-containing protein [Gemmatimonadota bacterium]
MSAKPATAAAPRAGSPDPDTRGRLLDAGMRLFAEHGYHNVSVRDLCTDAGANVAAVNYHFGGKLGLYREVVGAAITAIRSVSETLIFAPDGVPAEDRLRRYVQASLPLIAGRDPRVNAARASWIHQLMRHETSDPTPIAAWIAEQAFMPRVEYLRRIMGELLGCSPNDPRVRRCVMSVQSQLLFYAPDKFRESAFKGWPPNAAELARAADHIAEFSLAGIRRIATRGPGTS